MSNPLFNSQSHASSTPLVFVSNSPEETVEISKKIAKELNGKNHSTNPKNIICFFGDLGAGKTVFVKGIAEAFGIENYSVKSPTYTLIREYPHKKGTIIHVDLYRLNEHDEVLFKQIGEYASSPKNLVLIEWAEKLPKDFFDDKSSRNKQDICIEYIGRTTRKITVFQ